MGLLGRLYSWIWREDENHKPDESTDVYEADLSDFRSEPDDSAGEPFAEHTSPSPGPSFAGPSTAPFKAPAPYVSPALLVMRAVAMKRAMRWRQSPSRAFERRRAAEHTAAGEQSVAAAAGPSAVKRSAEDAPIRRCSKRVRRMPEGKENKKRNRRSSPTIDQQEAVCKPRMKRLRVAGPPALRKRKADLDLLSGLLSKRVRIASEEESAGSTRTRVSTRSADFASVSSASSSESSGTSRSSSLRGQAAAQELQRRRMEEEVEWERRRQEVERQNEEARRAKQRRKQEAAAEQLRTRQQARVAEMKRQEEEGAALAERKSRLLSLASRKAAMRARGRGFWELLVEFGAAEAGADGARPEAGAVKRAYRKALGLYHPDRFVGESVERQADAEEVYKLLQNAFEAWEAGTLPCVAPAPARPHAHAGW